LVVEVLGEIYGLSYENAGEKNALSHGISVVNNTYSRVLCIAKNCIVFSENTRILKNITRILSPKRCFISSSTNSHGDAKINKSLHSSRGSYSSYWFAIGINGPESVMLQAILKIEHPVSYLYTAFSEFGQDLTRLEDFPSSFSTFLLQLDARASRAGPATRARPVIVIKMLIILNSSTDI